MSNTILYFISSLFEIYALGIYSGQLFLPRHSKHTRIILLSVFCLVFIYCWSFSKCLAQHYCFCMYSWYLYVFAVSDNLVYLSVSHFSFDCSGCAYGDGCIWNYQFLLSGQHSIPDKYNCPFCTCAFQQTTLSLYRPDDCTSSAQ